MAPRRLPLCSPPTPPSERTFDRRRFLGAAAATAAVAPACAATSSSSTQDRTFPRVEGTRSFTPREHAVLAAMQDHLLPSEPGAPGARDVDAIAFLDDLLARGDAPRRVARRIREGVVDIEREAAALGRTSFVDLSPEQRELALRTHARRYKGRRFLRYVLEHTLEAFLGDPLHGGNPDEVVWRYLDHRAGAPRPVTRELPVP